MVPKIVIEDIPIELTRKKIKTLRMRIIPPDGAVKISAPLNMPETQIRSFVISKLNWIKTHQQRLASTPKVTPLTYTDGEMHFYQGISYPLHIIEHSKPARADLVKDAIILYLRPNSCFEKRKDVLNSWYREQLKIRIPQLIAYYEPILNVSVTSFGIKQMKTKWGTCNITAKRIWINLELAKKSPDCLAYIVVHEMVHLLESGHNKRFYRLMDQFMPNWKSAEIELNGKK